MLTVYPSGTLQHAHPLSPPYLSTQCIIRDRYHDLTPTYSHLCHGKPSLLHHPPLDTPSVRPPRPYSSRTSRRIRILLWLLSRFRRQSLPATAARSREQEADSRHGCWGRERTGRCWRRRQRRMGPRERLEGAAGLWTYRVARGYLWESRG